MIKDLLTEQIILEFGIDYADKDEMIENGLQLCFPPTLEDLILPQYDKIVKNKNTKYTSSIGYFDKFIK